MKKHRIIAFVLMVIISLASVPATHATSLPGVLPDRDTIPPNDGLVTLSSPITPYYTLIGAVHGTCYIENGKIYMSGTVSSGKATSCSVTITLQKNSGSGWTAVSSWSKTGTTSATKMAEYTPSAGLLYRLKIYGYVSNGTSNESETIYTKTVAL